MRKIRNIAIILSILFFTVMCITSSVYAATLSDVKYSDSKITISGTCTTSDQIQVIVFDLSNKPMYLATVKVENNKFSKTLDATFDLEEGKEYAVKISDYNGKNVSTDTFVAENPKADSKEKDVTPKTGVTEYVGIATFVVTVAALGIIYLKRKNG